ncbi:MAG: small multi-drug export protein [Candidatus Aenigmatarchaeota archaeon]|nr:MAG: small multi-drug export protein [Candidatus Aenigmarchaeota archaeon]
MHLPIVGKIKKSHQAAVEALLFVLPWALTAFYIISALFLLGDRSTEFLGLVGAYVLTPLGKGSIIPLAVALDFDPFVIASYIALIDVIIGLFFAWNWNLLLKIPLVGPLLKSLALKTSDLLKHRVWVRELAYTGIALFMALPIQPGGSITAAVFGRILGLESNKTVTAIAIGATISSFGYAYAASGVITAFRENIYLGIAVVAALLLIAHYVYHAYLKPLDDHGFRRR